MTLFEYLAIAFSLIFSLSGMRLVGGLPHAFDSSRRYWVHLCFVAGQLLITVTTFWMFWSFRSVEWTSAKFFLVLMSPGLIYYNACVLIPESPSSVDSWRDYFFAVRRRYFIGVICWSIALMVISTVVLSLPLLHPSRGLQATLLTLGIAGATSASHRVQAGIAVVLLALTLLIALTVGLRPDSFIRQ